MKRYEVLKQLLNERSHKIGCEVGVNIGTTTKFLLKNLPDIERYYVVDPWKSYTFDGGQIYNGPAKRKKTKKAIKEEWYRMIRVFLESTEPYSHRIVMLRMTSVEAINHVSDKSLDWVFIDAHHRPKFIKENLRIWTPKVKVGGIISGHDYGNPNEKRKGWGIKTEVDLFVPEDKLHVEDDYTFWFEREK